MSQKITVLFHCLLGDFWQKLHWGHIYPPLPGQGLKSEYLANGASDPPHNVAQDFRGWRIEWRYFQLDQIQTKMG